MNTLLLMRHAKSSHADANLSDHDRPLNRRGNRNAPQMADLLREKECIPDKVVCSSALRTRQTADLMAPILNCPVEVRQELYLAPVETIETVVNSYRALSCLLVIAHNPGIEEFAYWVTDEIQRIPTATIIRFDVPDPAAAIQTDSLRMESIWRPPNKGTALDAEGDHQ